MKIVKLILTVLSIFLVISFSHALYVEHNVDEDIEVTKLLDGRESLYVKGTLEIKNPSILSKIYEYRLDTNLPSGVFGNFKSSNPGPQILGNRFYGYEFTPNSSFEVSYTFSGIINNTVVNQLSTGNTSFLELFSNSQYTLKPSINVDKPIMESEAQSIINKSTNEIDKINSSTTEPRRVVSSKVSNPSEFFVIGKKLKILRTNVSDTFLESQISIGEKENFSIAPLGNIQIDFIDENSSTSSVYWVQSKISAKWEWNSSITFKSKTQSRPTSNGGGGGGGSSSSPSSPNQESSSDEEFQRDNLIIKKEVDKLFVTKGEELEVTIKVINLGSKTLEEIYFSDIIPEGYSLKAVDNANVNDNMLEFSVASLGGYSETELKYTLVKEEVERSFTYLPPVNYQGEAILEGTLVVEELLGDAKLFVQKEVSWIDSEFSKVVITIRNVGENQISNFRLFDDINERYRMRDISEPFLNQSRGMWEISTLGPGSQWRVEYLVENHNSVSELPLLLGVDESQVYGTVIINSHMSSMIQQKGSIFETIGVVMAGLILLAYILF